MNLYLDSSTHASALTWRDALDSPLTFATWDRDLSTAADRAGLTPLPSDFD